MVKAIIRHPTMNSVRKAAATSTNESAVPSSKTSRRNTIPSTKVDVRTPTPVRIEAGSFHARVTIQPMPRAIRNGPAVRRVPVVPA